jgi:hypothetical protein
VAGGQAWSPRLQRTLLRRNKLIVRFLKSGATRRRRRTRICKCSYQRWTPCSLCKSTDWDPFWKAAFGGASVPPHRNIVSSRFLVESYNSHDARVQAALRTAPTVCFSANGFSDINCRSVFHVHSGAPVCFGVCLVRPRRELRVRWQAIGHKDEEAVLCANCVTSYPVPRCHDADRSVYRFPSKRRQLSVLRDTP